MVMGRAHNQVVQHLPPSLLFSITLLLILAKRQICNPTRSQEWTETQRQQPLHHQNNRSAYNGISYTIITTGVCVYDDHSSHYQSTGVLYCFYFIMVIMSRMTATLIGQLSASLKLQECVGKGCVQSYPCTMSPRDKVHAVHDWRRIHQDPTVEK